MIVAVKDLGEVDNDYFLIPVGIRDHEGPLAASFPVENRLLPQGVSPVAEQILCGCTNSSQHEALLAARVAAALQAALGFETASCICSALLECEHRHALLVACCAGPEELRDHLKKYVSRPFHEALADFHLLLYLAAQPNFDLNDDVSQFAAAVKDRSDVSEGYKMIVESIAGI